MKVFVAIVLFCFSTFASADFTPAEKTELLKYVQSEIQSSRALSKAGRDIQQAGHLDRATKAHVVNALFQAKRRTAFFIGSMFATDVSSQGREENVPATRVEQINAAFRFWESALFYLQSAIRGTEGIPSLDGVRTDAQSAMDILSSFDWSLAYENPLFEDNPNTPWDESRTIVGPHGEGFTSKHTLVRAIRYVGDAAEHLMQFYREAPAWPATTDNSSANKWLGHTIIQFERVLERVATALAMHGDVMSDSHRSLLFQDQALSSGLRDVDFFRALLQTELLFGGRMKRPVFSGREVTRGAIFELRRDHFGQILLSVSTVLSSEEMTTLLIRAHQYIADRADGWGDVDRWAISGILFFDPLSPPNPPQ